MPSPNRKRLIQNGVLAAIVAILVYVVFNASTNQEERFKTLYDDSIGDEATEILIQNKGKADVLLQRINSIWRVVKPTEFEADKEQVRHLFTLLSENAGTSYDLKHDNREQYGLDEERLSISFNGVRLIFGDYNSVSQKRYILKDDTMYLVSETVSGLLQAGEEAFRIKATPTINEN